jgi:hypothetical protein
MTILKVRNPDESDLAFIEQPDGTWLCVKNRYGGNVGRRVSVDEKERIIKRAETRASFDKTQPFVRLALRDKPS